MKIRIAALIIVIAALIWALNPNPNYAEMSAKCLDNTGRMTDVVATCTALIEVGGLTSEQYSSLLSARGWAYSSGEQYDQALADYDAASKLHPKDATPVLRRALALEAMGDIAGAEAAHNKAVALFPDNATAHMNKARFAYRQGDFSEVIASYETALEIDPAREDAAAGLTRTLLEVEGANSLGLFLQRAKLRWPKQQWVHIADVNYNVIHTADQAKAWKALAQLARLKPDPAFVLWLEGYFHLNIGDEIKGIENIRKVAAHQSVGDESKEDILIERWYNAAVEWYLWRGNEELLLSGYLFALAGRSDLAEPDLNTALQGFGYTGRSEILDVFVEDGVVVPKEAYEGSTPQLEKVVAEYVARIAESRKMRSILR